MTNTRSVPRDQEPRWIPAGAGDADAIHSLRNQFCQEEEIVFEPAVQKAALERLLKDSSMGEVLVFMQTSGEVGGFLVLTWGFSLEFNGRYALLDELFLAPECRGRGFGQSGIEAAVDWAKSHDDCAVRLEVNHRNAGARKLYERFGFIADGREIFTLRYQSGRTDTADAKTLP